MGGALLGWALFGLGSIWAGLSLGRALFGLGSLWAGFSLGWALFELGSIWAGLSLGWALLGFFYASATEQFIHSIESFNTKLLRQTNVHKGFALVHASVYKFTS